MIGICSAQKIDARPKNAEVLVLTQRASYTDNVINLFVSVLFYFEPVSAQLYQDLYPLSGGKTLEEDISDGKAGT